jgi:hypothetical protein
MIERFSGGKLIFCGSRVELFTFFDNPISFSSSNSNAIRARINLTRKINSNAGQWYDKQRKRFYMPLFLTLTFKDNVTDLYWANKQFMLFVKRFNFRLFGDKLAVLKFVCVPEFQARGAVHYHLLLFNVPYTPMLKRITEDVWGLGFCWYESVRDIDNVGAYIAKYLSKSVRDSRMVGRKSYFSSLGLYKPYIVKADMDIAYYISILPVPSFSFETSAFRYESFDVRSSGLRFVNVLKGR